MFESWLYGRRLTVTDAGEKVVSLLTDHWSIPEVLPETSWHLDWGTSQQQVPGAVREQGTLWHTMQGSVHGWGSAKDVWLWDTSGHVHLQLHGQHLRILSSPHCKKSILHFALCEALRISQLLPLHAAVVGKGETTLALTAPSGTGKTTTLIRLLQAGWTAISEDFSWVEPSTRTVCSWDRGIHVLPETLQHLQLQSQEVRDDKHRLDFARFGGRSWTARLTDLSLLKRQAAPQHQWNRLSGALPLVVLHQAVGPSVHPPTRQWTEGVLLDWSKTLPCWSWTLAEGLEVPWEDSLFPL